MLMHRRGKININGNCKSKEMRKCFLGKAKIILLHMHNAIVVQNKIKHKNNQTRQKKKNNCDGVNDIIKHNILPKKKWTIC